MLPEVILAAAMWGSAECLIVIDGAALPLLHSCSPSQYTFSNLKTKTKTKETFKSFCVAIKKMRVYVVAVV